MQAEYTIESRRARHQAEIMQDIVRQVIQAVDQRAAADKTLSDLFRKHREYGSRDRRLYSNAVFAWFRWRGWLQPLSEMDFAGACALAWLLSYQRFPDAIKWLCRERKWPLPEPADAYAAASLEEKAHVLQQHFGIQEDLSAALLAPDWVPTMLHAPRETYREILFARFIDAIQQRPPSWLRAPAAIRAGLPERLASAGYRTTFSQCLDTAFFLSKPFHLPRLRKEAGGPVEIQDLASQCVTHIAQPQPGQCWWDVCAGAGGKTLHLADAIQHKGRIAATDHRSRMLTKLQQRLQGNDRNIVHLQCLDARHEVPEQTHFDGVLIDAPCSGIGTWPRNPDMRWRTHANSIMELVPVQQQIMHCAASAVHKGGRLIYAVCTVTQAETMDVVAQFLETHPDFSLAPVLHPLTNEQTDGCVWIWPWMNCNGMFIANFIRDHMA